ncbi:hypothetical protein E2C01_054344 [Portunus trituberculatus]|uniref:Uncharacterized protein n=1 Tax=Portunus trituberculatus TaxID=210409 RepID=A0A5B7GRS0_PORTR|nr:hypothetical protein [Portunus trituberculatus]
MRLRKSRASVVRVDVRDLVSDAVREKVASCAVRAVPLLVFTYRVMNTLRNLVICFRGQVTFSVEQLWSLMRHAVCKMFHTRRCQKGDIALVFSPPRDLNPAGD